MARKEVDPLDEFLDKRHRYRSKSRKEGMAIVAACWAAARVFDSPVYRRHFAL